VRQADSEEMLEMALVENVQREELNPIEVALGYHRLMEECGLTQEDVAKKVSKSRATVANFLRLLRLPPRIQAALRDKEVAMGHARALVSIDDTEAQMRLLKETIDNDLSVRSVEQMTREWHQAQEAPDDDDISRDAQEEEAPAPDRDDLELEALRGKLRSHFSTQVKIHNKSDGEGRIELAYYSQEDLERLMDLLLG
jgi:ParB family chromosome partitioning protein